MDEGEADHRQELGGILQGQGHGTGSDPPGGATPVAGIETEARRGVARPDWGGPVRPHWPHQRRGGSRRLEAGRGAPGSCGLLQLTLGWTCHLSLRPLIAASTPVMGLCFTPGPGRGGGEGTDTGTARFSAR